MRTLAVVCLLAACRSTSATSKLDASIRKTVHDSHLVGLEALIVDHGHVVLDKGYGFTDLDRTTPITADTVFAIGSLSKQFTAAAVLRLVDEGKLAVTDHAAQYLPELPADITIQQLLWQTTGLADYALKTNLGKTPDELVHAIATTPQLFPTGTKWAYSNSNYYVLGRIVEIVSKQSLADYLRDQVVARAGLTTTTICAADTAQAKPTVVAAGAAVKGEPLTIGFYGGAGGVCSTAHDLVRWQDALFGGKVLSPAALATMTTPGKLADGSAITYAAGLIADRVGTHPRIWHNGALPSGYESELTWYPGERLQIVLLTNTLNIPPARTLGQLEHALAKQLLHITTPKPRDLALGSAALAAYTGQYKTDSLAADVTVAGSHLHVRVAGGVDDDLLAQGSGSFVLAKNPGVEYRFAGANLDVYKDGNKIVTLQR
jgi:CubicO group peptidase (beta-lactamase class C family)